MTAPALIVRQVSKDVIAGVVVFLVALPLSLGIAMASNAPPLAGVVAAVIGGVVVALFSGSHTSVSGPAAGLTAVVADQIAHLGSFQALLTALIVAGAIQIGLGVAKAGFISAFFPTSVIKGLLAAIGVILVLKQIPHLLGHDTDPEGDMAFVQHDGHNTFSEFLALGDYHLGAALIGVVSLVLLLMWDRIGRLKHSGIPAPLIVVVLGVAINWLLQSFGESWAVRGTHLVNVPIADDLREFASQLASPDLSVLNQPRVYLAGFTIAIVASLETLLNLEAVDKLDPRQRTSPPSRELVAQGIGNLTGGIFGGLPVTAVIVRGTVNISAGAQTKFSAIVHGLLMGGFVLFLPGVLNLIPLACLAAILLHTGIKLASPKLVRQLWNEGRYQFVPFLATVVAIVWTDLLIGVVIGFLTSLAFILYSNFKRPLRRHIERHLGGDVLNIQLANQVSFLNRAAIAKALNDVPRGGHVLIDASATDYIDPDVLDLLRDYVDHTAPARGVKVSCRGFRQKYNFQDQIQYVDYSTRELQSKLTPQEVLRILKEGHQRFLKGRRLTRDFGRLVTATADGQHPLAVVLSCFDSRTPVEVIFDLAMGDVFSARIAGNVISPRVLGSLEYATSVAGARLVMVLGHTRCGAVAAAVAADQADQSAMEATGCEHLESILADIRKSITDDIRQQLQSADPASREELHNQVALNNVCNSMRSILRQSEVVRRLVDSGQVGLVGGLYDVVSGDLTVQDWHDLIDQPQVHS